MKELGVRGFVALSAAARPHEGIRRGLIDRHATKFHRGESSRSWWQPTMMTIHRRPPKRRADRRTFLPGALLIFSRLVTVFIVSFIHAKHFFSFFFLLFLFRADGRGLLHAVFVLISPGRALMQTPKF
jgi:hypothetical protein